MGNFSSNQSISVQGLCQTLISTDTSDYVNNIEGFTVDNIDFKRWTFRDSSGTIIKQFTGGKNDLSCSCAISLLTLNITVELAVVITNHGDYTVQNSFIIPCLLT